MTATENATTGAVIAAMADFTDPNKLLKAAEGVRDAGYTKWDCYTPYPIHGLDAAMGVKKTILPKIALGAAAFGLFNGWFLQYWTGSIDYPLNIGGKPMFAVEFGVPVMFELTILLTGVTTVLAMFGVLCRLPRWFSPYQHDKGFQKAVDDTHVVVLEAEDDRFHANSALSLLEKLGGHNVRLVYADASNEG